MNNFFVCIYNYSGTMQTNTFFKSCKIHIQLHRYIFNVFLFCPHGWSENECLIGFVFKDIVNILKAIFVTSLNR